jgi:hypothetical protein
MSKTVKIIISALVIVGGLFVGVSIYVSSQINPELIRKEAVKVIAETFPNADVKMEKLDYSLGTNVSFNIDNFSLSLKKDKSNLINVSKLEVKIPLLSILTAGGSVDVLIDSPKVGFKKFAKDTNWDRAMGAKAKVTVKKDLEKTDEKKSSGGTSLDSLPSFAKNSKVNLRIMNTSLDYVLDPKMRGNVVISKVIVKNININSSAAFEIASQFKMNMGADQMSSNILLVGDFDIKKYLEKEEISSSMVLKLLKNKFKAMSLPSVQTKVKAEISKDGAIMADIDTSIDNIITLKSIANLKGDNAKLSNFDFGINFNNAFKYLKDDMGITIAEVNPNKSELHIKGTVSANLKSMKVEPILNIGTTKPLMISASGVDVAASFSGAINGKNIDLSVKKELFKGVLTASVKTILDPMNLPGDLSKYNPVNVDIKATGFHIERADMQKLLYSGKKDPIAAESSDAETAKAVGPEVPLPKLPPVITNINFDQCFIGKDILKIKGRIPFKNNIVSTKGMKVNLGKGDGSISFNTALESNLRSSSKFDFSMKDLNFSTFSVFLPPIMKRVEGYFTGKASGSVNMKPEGLSYSVKADVEAGDGKIEGVAFGKLLGGMKDKLKGKVKIPDSKDIPDGFKKLVFKGNLTDKEIKINSFLFYGVGDKIFLKAKGKKNKVSMSNTKSQIEAEFKYPHGKAMSELKSKTGLKAYPLLLKGQGFGLMPDFGYTVNKVVSAAGKQAANKAKKKAKKKIKKKLDKFKDDLLKKFKF